MNQTVIFLMNEKPVNYERFTPVSMLIDGQSKSVSSWEDVYTATLEYLYKNWKYVLLRYENEMISGITSIVLANDFHKSQLRKGLPVGKTLFAEADLPTDSLIRILRLLVRGCNPSINPSVICMSEESVGEVGDVLSESNRPVQKKAGKQGGAIGHKENSIRKSESRDTVDKPKSVELSPLGKYVNQNRRIERMNGEPVVTETNSTKQRDYLPAADVLKRNRFATEFENIRKDRLGVVNSSVYPGLKKLVAEIYPEEAHFIYELLQNAEDAQATKVRFEIESDRLIFSHNGTRMFDSDDIDSITNIAKSTKSDNYIQAGKFGIGFKSVYVFTDTPYIYCDSVCFKIEKLLLPTVIPDLPERERGWTVFHFPFKEMRDGAERITRLIRNGFRELEPSTLLFLNSIYSIEYSYDNFRYRIESFRNENLVLIELRDGDDNVIETNAALKFSRTSTLNGKKINVDIAFPVKQKKGSKDWSFVKGSDKVFITFLAKNERSHLKFYINAPFGCTPSRDSVNKHDQDNVKLIEEVALLMKDSLAMLHGRHLLNDDFLELMPLPTEAVPGFYTPLLSTVYKEFRENKYLLSVDGDYVRPADAMIQTKNLEKIVTITDVRSIWGNEKLQFIRSRARNLSVYKFLEVLGIKEISSGKFLNRLEQISNDTLKEFVKSKSDSELMSLYAFLYKGMEEFLDEYYKYESYRKKADARPWQHTDKDILEQYDKYCIRKKRYETLELIRDISGEVVSAESTYFLEDEVEVPKEFYIVKPDVYEDPVAKKFLILLGVKSFSGKEVEEYRYNNEIGQMKNCLEQVTSDTDPLDLARKILRFLEKHVEEEVDFLKYPYVKAYDKLTQSYRFVTAEKCFLDEPFIPLNGFGQLDQVHHKMAVSEEYLELKEEKLRKWIDFLKRQGIFWTIKVQKMDRSTKARSGHNIDYFVDRLEAYLLCRNMDFNLYLWSHFTHADNWVKDVYKYHSRKRTARAKEEITDSKLVSVLRNTAWVPDKEGNLYRPAEITRNDIDIRFVVDERNGFLADIEFEKQARERIEQERIQKEKERMQQEENIQVLHDLGFENAEEVWAARESVQLFAELMSLGIDPKKLLEKTRNRNKAEALKRKERELSELERNQSEKQDSVERMEEQAEKPNDGRVGERTDEQADEQEVKRTDEQTDEQAMKRADKQRAEQTDKRTDVQADDFAMDEFLDDILGEFEERPGLRSAKDGAVSGNKRNSFNSQTKKVVRDILQQAKRQAGNNYSEPVSVEDEPDYDEFLPTRVDYRKKIEQAKQKSAREIDRIVYIEELQQRALEAKKYSYIWFKTLLEMESINASDANANSREVSISFSKVEREPGTERTLVLRYPNRYIPHFMEDLADIPLVLHIGEQRKVLPIEVANIKSYTLRVKIKSGVDFTSIDLNAVNQATIDAKSPVFLLEELRKQFAELGYEDAFDMMGNLPENIEFIFGPPGTGKTTYLARNVLRPMMDNQMPCKVLVLTPTNKSADVLVRRLMEEFGEDKSYEEWLVRFGATGEESIESSPVYRDKTFDIRALERCVTVTTIARFPYDFFMPENTRIFLNGYNWDYIVIDEASMIPAANIVYPLFKKTPEKFIIAGDPFQIEPIVSVDLWKNENIYTMVGLDSFSNPVTRPHRYKVECLTTQYRSVPDIGYLFSNFAYGGILKHYRSKDNQRVLNIDPGLGVKTVNVIKFPVSKYESIYRAKRLHHSSSYQVYSALFTYEYACFLAREISKYNSNKEFKIGIIAPYRAQADMIDKLLAAERLTRGVEIQVGTIHGFQGDECDVIFAVFNTPPTISSFGEMFLNKRNIINVSISRARDYLFVIMPDDDTENIANLRLVNRVVGLIGETSSHNEFLSTELERLMFGDDHYLENNAFSTSHQSVNVYGLPERRYEVRTEEDAVDIQVHKGNQFSY